jgi:hypothetical protein
LQASERRQKNCLAFFRRSAAEKHHSFFEMRPNRVGRISHFFNPANDVEFSHVDPGHHRRANA